MMTDEDKFVELVREASETGLSAFTQAGCNIEEEDVRDYYSDVDNSFGSRVIVNEGSFIVAHIYPLEFNNNHLVCAIAHYFSMDGTGHELLSEIEQWATDAGCKMIYQPTLYNNDPRLVKYYQRRGYKHSGFTFTKEI